MTAEPHPQPDPLFLVTESELWEIYLTDAEGIIKIREVLSRPVHQQSEWEIREKVLDEIMEELSNIGEEEADDGYIRGISAASDVIEFFRSKQGERP